MRKLVGVTVATILAGALSTGRVDAALIVDQQFIAPIGFSVSTTLIGQTFTPTLSGIDYATFYFNDNGVAGSATYHVEVRSGVNGALLASSNSVLLNTADFPDSFSVAAPSQFDFSSTVALTPGTTYSLMLVRESVFNGLSVVGSSSGYGGGEAVFGGLPNPIYDFHFSEGLRSVPEPASLILVGTALAGVAWRRRRARP